ncbi:hypothetical protein [Hartmannibacter diazotrophicus]|uniref:hypothetical protein n=1 Tax=Hartmannibacter diazotrophicus TaxID=1482074 RepID=UPI0012FDF5A0|nr:hypothetical protein [Hartmannibacter diazotrophicus]
MMTAVIKVPVATIRNPLLKHDAPIVEVPRCRFDHGMDGAAGNSSSLPGHYRNFFLGTDAYRPASGGFVNVLRCNEKGAPAQKH